MTSATLAGVGLPAAEVEKPDANTGTPEEPKAQTVPKPPLPAGGNGLQLNTLDDYWRFAQYVLKARLAPKGMETAEAVVCALQLGAEVGLPPMASVQNIMVVNGRPTIWGDAMLAVAQRSGMFDEKVFTEWFTGAPGQDDYTAHCRVQRIGSDHPTEQSFSVKQAKSANLWGKSGPWSAYPWRMLQMRARAFALRDRFADVLKGLYATEELLGVDKLLDRMDLTGLDEPPKTNTAALKERLDAVKAKAAAGATNNADSESEKLGRSLFTPTADTVTVGGDAPVTDATPKPKRPTRAKAKPKNETWGPSDARLKLQPDFQEALDLLNTVQKEHLATTFHLPDLFVATVDALADGDFAALTFETQRRAKAIEQDKH